MTLNFLEMKARIVDMYRLDSEYIKCDTNNWFSILYHIGTDGRAILCDYLNELDRFYQHIEENRK